MTAEKHKQRSSADSDQALKVLTAQRDQQAENIPMDLIAAILQTERAFQFEQDRRAAIDRIDEIIDEYCSSISASDAQL